MKIQIHLKRREPKHRMWKRGSLLKNTEGQCFPRVSTHRAINVSVVQESQATSQASSKLCWHHPHGTVFTSVMSTKTGGSETYVLHGYREWLMLGNRGYDQIYYKEA